MKSISQFIKEHSGSHANDVTKTEFLEALAELDNVADELEEDVELNILADEREDVSEAKKSWKDAERSGYDAWMSNIKRNKNPNKKKGQERDSWFDGWDNAQLDSDNGDFDESFSEEKSGTGYTLHHKTLGSAIDTAISHAKKQYGIEITDDERMDQVGMGPRKPANGKTNSYRLMGSDKSGKEKGVQVQVYNMGNKYELNMYKESVELEESVELDERTINGWKISTLPKSGEYNYTADKSGYASNKFHNLSAAEKFAEKNPSKNWHKESLDEKAPKIDSDKYAAHMNRNKKVVKKTSATQDYIKDVQKRSNKMGEAISMKNSINQYYYQDPKGVVQAVGSKDAMRKMNIKQAKDGNKGGSFSMNFKKHKVGDIIKEGKTKPVSQMTPKEKADNDARRKEYKAFQKSMKKESVEIDETVGALGMESAAKAIEKYAKSHGGIDEKDFMIAAKLLRKGLDMKLKKFVDDMDTEPREYVITAMAKSMGKKNVEKMFGVKLREKVLTPLGDELSEYANKPEMVCEDCGCAPNQAKEGCECPNDNSDLNGSHWVVKDVQESAGNKKGKPRLSSRSAETGPYESAMSKFYRIGESARLAIQRAKQHMEKSND